MKVLSVYESIEDSRDDVIYIKMNGMELAQLVNYLTNYRYIKEDEGWLSKSKEIYEFTQRFEVNNYISKDFFDEKNLSKEFERLNED